MMNYTRNERNYIDFSRKTLALLFILILSFSFVSCKNEGAGNVAQQQSVYDRVVKTGTIRASYASYPPYCIKDPNTGKLTGMLVEVIEEAAKRLNLKVAWVEEVGWGAIFEGLNSDRHDIFGAGIWRNASRGKVGDFTRPLLFNAIKVYGRPDETRFKSLESINEDSVKISTLDGAIEDVIAKSDYPKANRVSVSQLNPWTDVLMNITSKKADLTFAEPVAVNLYLAKNPGTLKDLFPGHPVRIFALAYAFKLGEPKFKAMIDATLEEMQNDGSIENIVRKYEKVPGEYYRVALPYQDTNAESFKISDAQIKTIRDSVLQEIHNENTKVVPTVKTTKYNDNTSIPLVTNSG